MRRRTLLAGLLAGPLAPPLRTALAGAGVPVPDGFMFLVSALPAVQAAMRRKALSVLAIVGPMVSREAARDPARIYPSQLAERLRTAWPGVSVSLELQPIARAEMPQFETLLTAALAQHAPALVVWGAGGSAAARGDDLDSFHVQLQSAIRTARQAQADLILMTPQYAPMVARLMNLPPYRTAVLQEAQDAGIPVLDRYELLQYWADNAILDLDAADPIVQTSVARTVNEWIADLLAGGIVHAVNA